MLSDIVLSIEYSWVQEIETVFNQNAGVNALIFHILEHGIYFLTKFFFAEIGIAVEVCFLRKC